MEQDAFLIGYSGTSSLEIDLFLARAQSHNAMFTFQKLKLNINVLVWEQDKYPILNVLFIPCADEEGDRQANLDLAGRLLHFECYIPKAWSRMNCLMTKMFRCPDKISEELFINLREYCKFKKSVSSGLVKLLKWDFEKHLKKCPKAWTAALFNACVSLRENGFDSKDILELCRKMKPFFPVISANGNSLLEHIYEASQVFQADCIQSLVTVQQFLALSQSFGHRPLNKDGVYLTRHDNRPSLLSVMEGLAVQVPYELRKFS